MADKHPIDKQFDKLHDHEVAAPDFVWANIEAAIPKEKRKPKGIFWWSGGLLLLAVFALYVEHDLHTKTESSIALHQATSATTSTGTGATISMAETEGIQTTSDKGSLDANKRTVESSTLVQNNALSSEINAQLSALKSSDKTTLQDNQNLALQAPSYSTASAAQKSVKSTTIRGVASEFFEKTGLEKMPRIGQNQSSSTPSAVMENSNEQKNTQNTLNQYLISGLATKKSLAKIELLSHSTAFMSADRVKLKHKTFPQTKKYYSCFDFSEVGSVLALEAYAGPAFGFRNWTTDDASFDAWRNTRLSQEHNRFAWTAGVNAALLTKRTLVLRAGLQVTQQNEVFKFDDPLYVLTTIKNLTSSNGSITSDTSQEIGYKKIRTDNRLTMVDIPVSVGYELRKGRKGINLYVGAAANLYFHKKGEFLDNEGERFNFGENKSYFRTTAGLSLHGGAQFFYTIRPSVRVFAEPYFKQMLQPLTLDNQGISQNYTFFGIKFGVSKAIF